MAQIYNTKSNTLLSGTSGNDDIRNGGRWDYSYHDGGSKVTISGNEGNDYIANTGQNVSISGGMGSDKISNGGEDVTINGGDGNDWILDDGLGVKISGGAGDDTIYNQQYHGVSSNESISGGDGNDSIDSLEKNVTISGGNGSDTIYNQGSNSSVNGGAGSDFISNWGSKVTIDAGTGADSIENLENNVTIGGSKGNDTIYNGLRYGSGDTVYGNRGSNVQFTYSEGDGNDVIYGVKSDSTIQIATNSSYTSQQSNDDVIIKVGEGSITLKDAKDKSLNIVTENLSEDENAVKYTSGNDSIQIPRDNIKVEALAGNDTVENAKKNVTISAGDGDDSIHNTGSQVTIDGGNGDDTVINSGDSVSIIGGANDDSIINYGDSTTIKGGTGTDTIRLVHLVRSSEFSCNTLIQYSLGDGNDTILDIASTDLIHITNGSYSTQVSDNDLIIKVGENSITLKDAANRKLQIKNSNGEIETVNPNGIVYYCNNTANTQILGSSHADSIYNVAPKVTIETGEGNNIIYNRADNHYSPSLTSILVGSGDNIISNYDADQVTVKTGNGNNQISNWNGDKVTIQSGSGDDTISNDAEYGGNISTALIETDDGKDIISNGLYFSKVTIDAGNGNDSISNSGNNVSISGGNGDDTVQIKSESDNTTANGGQDSDTFTINLSTYSGQPRTGKSAMIQDYESGKDKIVLEEASIASHSIIDSDVILTLKSENIPEYKLTLKNTKEKEITITDSDGNTTTQIYREETIQPEDEEEPYWTLKDLETLFDGLNEFIPAIPKLSEILDVSARVSSILDSVISIAKGEKKGSDLKAELTKVAGDITGITGDVRGLKGKDDTLWALSSTAIEGAGSYIAAFDLDKVPVTKEEKEKLQKKINNAVEDSVDLANETFGVILNKFLENIGSLSTGEINKIAKEIKRRYLRPAFAFLMVGYYGANQYRESVKDYTSQELPVALVAEGTFVDVLTSAVYGGIHQLTGKLDDLFVKTVAWVGFKIRGIEPKPIFNDKNYMELIAEIVKNGIFNSTNQADVTKINRAGKTHYAQDGDDYISNTFPNVKIYGGEGNDTIFSHKEATKNYLHGNNGRDFIITYGEDSTLKGASGDDKLVSYGDKNYISGDAGTDFILLKDASYNTITGGKESDIIALENAKNTLIYYSKGDGGDIIFGYDETDTIRISGKAEYTLSEEEQDVCIKVGSETIIIKEAKGKDIKIENRNTDKNPLDDIDPFNQNPIIMTQIGNLNLRSSESPQAVSLSSGNQTVQFNDKDGNIAIIDENATGRKNIIFGKGDDLGVFTSPNSNVKVAVGSGYDSIVVDNNSRVNVDMTKASDAIIIANNSKVTLSNYNASSNAGVLVPNVDDIASAVKDNSIQLVNNEVLLDSSTSVKFNDKSNDSTIVNLITDDGEIQKVGFTNSSGGELNTSKFDDNFVLKGNYAESSSDKQKRGSSIIIAGKGSDTILAGARDVIDGGNGKNQIYLTPYDLRSSKDGATIATSGNGRNTVYGFHDGLDYDSDCIKIGKLSDLTFKFESDGLLLNSGDSRLKFDGIGIDSSYSDNSEYLPSNLNADEPELILLTDGSSTVNAAIAQTNQSVSINSNDLETPNAFFGNRSGLSFSDFDDDLNIDLAKGIGNLGNTNATFKGINKLQAGNGKNSLIGSNDKNTLIAGNGYNSIWSGANNDKMIGKSDSEDKDGSTTFFFLAGDEHDIIANFEFINEDNKYDDVADKIDISNNVVTDVYHSGGDVVLQINDSSDYLTIKDAYGKDFRINNLVAKVDRNITYDGLANYYVADGGSSLIVDSSIGSAEIWLDNSHGTTFIGNINKIDASAVTGETSLVGNANDNTIIAGQGDASLWGGFSPTDDLLIGGESHNTFFYCLSNGNDTIKGVTEGDKVILSTVTLDQITETKITADSVSIDFIDGGSLQINGNSNVTYQLADGSKYSANQERLEWESK